MSSFVHLHNHTEYSLLDGATRIAQMVAQAKELEMPALAISDHGVMFGAMEFYMECQKAGIKPIIGMEAYVAPKGLHYKTGREENQTYHLLLLAKNLEGYKNLCKLHTIAALQGFYYKPRIDHEVLREHSKGLISSSTCLGSEVCQYLLAGDYEKAQYAAGMYKEIFEEGCYFIELQDHGLAEQAAIKPHLLKIARELKLPLMATNDIHYLRKEDAKPHDVLLCIGTGSLLSDQKRLKFATEEFYLKSKEEMERLFSDTPEAIENTLHIADMCNLELGKHQALMPTPELPEGYDSHTYLKYLAEKGLQERIANADDQTHERLQYELDVIHKTGFENYFLLVREFAQFTREQGIMLGVRGSAAGSLVSYCLGITDVNPIQYDITFERFLNIERIAMPDIDMDFEDARRDEVIRWVTEKYGKDRVAQIITFGTLGAKAAIRDAGRVMGYTPQETDRICKTISGMPGMTLKRALKECVEFRQLVETDPKVKALVEVGRSIEGLARHAGVHAAGIVISKDPLMEHIPLYRSSDGQAVTAYEMGILEKIGLLKMDFLGLSNLTILSRAIQNIKQTRGIEVDLGKIPLDDANTYELLGRGETVGVFQLEGGGIRRCTMEVKPQSILEIAAVTALYRPGPMEHIPRYISNKFGRTEPEYLDERMRPILSETYGIIVYQDQVLKLVQAVAGFSLGKADILRRAMGKKDLKAMESMKVEFFHGTRANNISDEVAEKIWELLLPFAGYAFNKAHAVCYAFVAYQTAYLKANYPVEYMAALLTVSRSREDKVTNFIEECRRQKIPVLPPDINRSNVDFVIEEGGIRFGLGAIKGIGDAMVKGILKERDEGKPFKHLFEFCERTKPFGMNKSALEALIKAGAFDRIERNRNKLLRSIEAALAYADVTVKSKLAGQESLFGDASQEETQNLNYPELPEAPMPERTEILAYEKEVMGIYVSDHPLRGVERQIVFVASHTCSSVQELEEGGRTVLAGVIAGLRTIITKSKKEKMASVVLEDLSGQVTCVAFPATYAKFKDLLVKDSVVRIVGQVVHRDRPNPDGEKSVELRIEEVSRLEIQEGPGLYGDDTMTGSVLLRIPKATESQLKTLRRLIESTKGEYGVVIQFGEGDCIYPVELLHRVEPHQEFVQGIRKTIPGCDIEVLEKSIAQG
jgi:DNA polymerase-3 subunit alpha